MDVDRAAAVLVDAAPFRMPIEGMTCASCVGRVERVIAAVPGVSAVSVNPATEYADVEFVDGRADIGVVVDAVEAAGYTKRFGGTPATASTTTRTCTCCASSLAPAILGFRLRRLAGYWRYGRTRAAPAPTSRRWRPRAPKISSQGRRTPRDAPVARRTRAQLPPRRSSQMPNLRRLGAGRLRRRSGPC